MNNRWYHDNTLVRTLRVRAGGLDPLTARVRAEGLLSAAGMRPAGLGPGAIFCVRRLRTRCLLPRVPADRFDWERGIQAALAVLLRQAARPAHALVPANAEAVLFADQAEMLACLARDGLTGAVSAHWWWRGLLHGTAIDEMIRTAWRDAPEHVPAALTHLAAWNLALPFVRAIGTEAAGTLLRKVARTHAVGIDVGLQPSKADAATDRNDRTGEEDSVVPVPQPPWRRWVPEASAGGLDVEQQCFLGVALMLHRAPQVVRAVPFAGDLLRWRRETAAKMAEGPFAHRIPGFHMKESDTPALAETPTASALELSHRERAAAPSGPIRKNPRAPVSAVAHAPHAKATEPGVRPADRRLDESDVSIARQEDPKIRWADPTSRRDVDAAWTERGDLVHRPVLDHIAEVSPQSHALLVDEGSASSPCEDKLVAPPCEGPILPFDTEATQTELGGLFYLINLGLFLDLYGDFTCPARPGLTLSIWDFVFLLGRRLLKEERTSDVVWDLLARLAGRDADTPPGREFEPPPEAWHLPADWLWPFGQADAAEPGEPYLPSAADVCTTRPIAKSPLDRWLDWLVPHVRRRLGRALGIADADDVAELLLVQRARVEVSATRLDVTLALADLPCAIRLAGLDRNPGWVPAAGRFVAFHYE